MIYDTIYSFFQQILGSQISTELGGIFATYGTYIFIGLLIASICRLVLGVANLIFRR